MNRIDEYNRVEEDQQQGKGKGKVISQERRDFRSDRYNNNRPQKDFVGQSGSTAPQVVNTVFWKLVHQVLKKIKNEPYFKWPNKMGGNLLRCNQSLHCQYHQERGHTTEDCKTESSRVTSQRGKVTTVFISAQQARRPIKVMGSGERFFKTPIRHNLCHLCCT